MKLDVKLVQRVIRLGKLFYKGFKKAQTGQGKAVEVMAGKMFGQDYNRSPRRYSLYEEDTEYEFEEDDMAGYQLHLPFDGEWHTCKATPTDEYEAIFTTGNYTSTPVVAWLTQVRAVAPQGTSGTSANSRVVAGIFVDGAVVNAADVPGFERIERR